MKKSGEPAVDSQAQFSNENQRSALTRVSNVSALSYLEATAWAVWTRYSE